MRISRNVRDERGAVLVMTALLIPALIAMGALSIGVTSLWAEHDDLQRSVDLGALAGAADTPTVDASAFAAMFPSAITGVTTTLSLGGVLDGTSWQGRPCAVALQQLTGTNSTMVNAFKAPDSASTCTAQWQFESPFLAAASACANNVLDVPSCWSRLSAQLGVTLPTVDTPRPDVSAIDAAAATLAGLYTDTSDKVMTASVATLLPGACAVYVPVVGCQQTVAQLIASLGLPSTSLPTRIGVDLPDLLPAVTTPRVQVSVDGTRVRPTFSPVTFGVAGSATARRTIKSAVVLPSLGVPGISSASAFSTLPTGLQTRLNTLFGGQAPAVLAAAGTQGFVVDPNDLNRNLLQPGINSTIGVVNLLNGTAMTSLQTALTTVGCTTSPLSSYCPQITGPDLSTQEAQFVQDLKDASAPPPSGTQPSLDSVLATYATTHERFWVVGALRRTELSAFFGQTVWSVLTNPAINPALAPLLSQLMFIPALDVVPVTVGRIVVGSTNYYALLPVARDTLATNGLYQGRLVK